MRGEKRLRVTRPEPRRVSSGVSRALALHDVTFLELWEAMMAIEPVAAAICGGAPQRRRSCMPWCAPAPASSARPADTDAAVAAVVDFFTAVAAASGNQVLALSQAPLNLLLAPALTRMIDRVPQARARIQEAQGRITDGDQAQDAASRRAPGWRSTSAISSAATSWNCSRAGSEIIVAKLFRGSVPEEYRCRWDHADWC